MSNTTLSDQLRSYLYNPSKMQDVALDLLEKASNGLIDIPDANHPFVYALEVGAVNSSLIIQNHDDLISQFYAKHARNFSDISRNMSDEDFVGIFATPSETSMVFVASIAEIRKLAVPFNESDDGFGNSYRKLVIPKDTVVSIMDVPFCIDYAIEIRLMQHEGFQVVYDANTPNPLKRLSSNRLVWWTSRIQNDECLLIRVPVRQYNYFSPKEERITSASGLNTNYSYTEQLYAVRAFLRKTDNDPWKEISVSYSKANFDSSEVTLSVSRNDDSIDVSMPEIYVTNGSALGKLRVFIYTTKGAYEKDYGSLKGDSYIAEFRDFDYDTVSLGEYSQPLNQIHNQTWLADSLIGGGSNIKSFEEIKSGVVYSSRRTDLPITPNQITKKVTDRGFDLLKSVDLVTKRIYYATRDFPVQENKDFGSSVGCITGSLIASLEQMSSSPTVKDNGSRVTILPETLFMLKDGIFSIVPEVNRLALLGMTNEDKCDAVANNQYLFTPFYYVVDTTKNQVTTRVYDLDQPVISSRTFYYENNSVSVNVGIGSYAISKTPSGYRMAIVTASSEDYKNFDDDDVALQMMYIPTGEYQYAYLNGVLAGRDANRERVWYFDIKTNMDIDDNNQLILQSFGMFGNPAGETLSPLKTEFRFINAISRDLRPNAVKTDSDKRFGESYYDKPMISVIEESFEIQFGETLKWMWSQTRPISSAADYQVYPEDVPLLHDQDVFLRDEKNQLVIEDGEAVIKFHKGDPVLDSQGNPRYLHRKDSTVFDNNGNPIIVGLRTILIQFDIVTLDGIYYLANTTPDQSYIKSIKERMISWVLVDMEQLNSLLLEQSWMYYMPKRTLGLLNITQNADEDRMMEASISFTISYYLTRVGYANENLKTSLRKSTPKILNQCLLNKTVANSSTIEALKTIVTDEVVDIKIVGFTNDGKEIDVVTVNDETLRFALKKKLVITAEKNLSVAEDVTVNFLRHKGDF